MVALLAASLAENWVVGKAVSMAGKRADDLVARMVDQKEDWKVAHSAVLSAVATVANSGCH